MVLEKVNFVIEQREKSLLLKNGEGKTTLMRILQKEIDLSSGKLHRGELVKIGYYAQNQNLMLNQNKTVFQTMDDIAVGDIRLKIRNILGSFLFTNEDVDKKVGVLSGGEKARLALAKLLLEPYNVLLLDEPTNHLDMQSKDILKNALLRYNGTLILVSHDRDFLQGLSNKVIEFKNKSIKVHLGDIDDYLEKRKIESLQLLNTKNVSTASKSPTANSETKNRWEQQKQKESDLRKITKQIENIEKEIQSLETAIEEMNRKLAIPENHSNEIASRELYQEYQLLQQKMDKSIAKWEDLCKKHEQLKNQ